LSQFPSEFRVVFQSHDAPNVSPVLIRFPYIDPIYFYITVRYDAEKQSKVFALSSIYYYPRQILSWEFSQWYHAEIELTLLTNKTSLVV
jgi:hypothetical protein